MRIAITGATGFLGKYVVRHFMQIPFVDLYLYGTSLKKLQDIYAGLPNIKMVETDYSVVSLEKYFMDFDAVVHLAARRLIPTDKRMVSYLDNVRITANLLEIADKFSVNKFILASTQGVYDPLRQSVPFIENWVSISNGYAFSKYMSEQLSQLYKTPVVSLRLGQLIGWGEREIYMFTSFLHNVRSGKPIVLWGKGGGGRDYLYAKDAAIAIEKAVMLDGVLGTYNLSMGFPISFKEFASALVDVFGSEESVIDYDVTKIEDTTIRYMSIDKLRNEFRWQPTFGLREAFIDMKNDEVL